MATQNMRAWAAILIVIAIGLFVVGVTMMIIGLTDVELPPGYRWIGYPA